MCVTCRHTLSYKDLIPVFSWVILQGRCRYCKKAISQQYPIVELLTSMLFLISLWQWPYEINTLLAVALFTTWCLIITGLMILAVYDLRWQELPTRVIYIIFGVGVLFVVVESLLVGLSIGEFLAMRLIGMFAVGGFFWLLYQFSSGTWIGGGDVRYGFLLGFLLGWQKGLLAVGIASYIGTLLALLLFILRRLRKKWKFHLAHF